MLLLCLLAAAPAAPAAAVEHAVLRADRPAVVEMRTAALIMSGQQGGGLPIAIGALPRGEGTTTVVVEVDGAALLEHSVAATVVTVEVFAYVLGDGLDALEVASYAFDVDLARHRDLLAATGLKVFLPLRPPAGEHQLRVLARAGDAFGLRGLDMAVGAPAGGGGRILRPVFHEQPRPWLLAVAADAAVPPPFGLDGSAPLPATRPILAPGETLVGQVWVTGDAPEPAGLRALVRSPGGDDAEMPLEVVARADSAPGWTAVTVSLTAPELTPGLYEIAVAAGASVDAARSSYAPIFVDAVAAPPAAAEVVTTAPAEPLPRPSRSQRKLLKVATDGYLRTLRQLADGGRRAALATLDASESRVVRALDAEAVPLLEQGEARVLADLDDADWGCVLPVILLHLDLSRAYAREKRHILAHHAIQMAVGLAASYAEKLATPEAAREAASAVSSLAGHLQQGGSLSRAERFFRQALTLADDDAAWLGLASIYEKRGLLDQALPAFETFVAARPTHAEARLRLALTRSRSGRSDQARQARRALESLAAGGGDWVSLLAYQELARLEMDEERLARAAEVLRRGLRRFPRHPTLTLQLAWVLDAKGQPLASQRLLADLDLAATVEPAGERSRYNRWPMDVQQASRRELAATATERLDDLGRWLESRVEAE